MVILLYVMYIHLKYTLHEQILYIEKYVFYLLNYSIQ